MAVIAEWKDLPDETTPLSAENINDTLNEIRETINNLVTQMSSKTILFENSNGVSAATGVTLSDNINNYDFCIVTYKNNQGGQIHNEVITTSGIYGAISSQTGMLDGSYALRMEGVRITLNNNIITFISDAAAYSGDITSTPNIKFWTNRNEPRLLKVVGFKI